MWARRSGKTLLHVEMTKAAQAAGKKVYWATFDQPATVALLAKHGALSELVGTRYVVPHFRPNKGERHE